MTEFTEDELKTVVTALVQANHGCLLHATAVNIVYHLKQAGWRHWNAEDLYDDVYENSDVAAEFDTVPGCPDGTCPKP